MVFFRSVRRLRVTANVVPNSPSLVALMMEAPRSSETSVLTRATRGNIPEAVKSSNLTKLNPSNRSMLRSADLQVSAQLLPPVCSNSLSPLIS
jgi:hypothetical protein